MPKGDLDVFEASTVDSALLSSRAKVTHWKNLKMLVREIVGEKRVSHCLLDIHCPHRHDSQIAIKILTAVPPTRLQG